ncbi:MAG: SpoIVB peptidase [Clostridia bacterium]|nr:SpoIVB peptidase [Clostridia bacterium]MDD4386802.1 SpoIVB peptidase [Clostridia bacterium]
MKKNRKYIFENKKTRILIISCIIIVLSIVFVYINYTDVVNSYSINKDLRKKINNMDIVIGGETVGIKLLATGVLIMGLDRDDVNLEIADVILKVDGNQVESNAELQNFTQLSKGQKMKLEIMRKDQIFEIEVTPTFDELSNEYKLGLWVKDSSAGVGTITFYDRKSLNFAALGHAVTETKENYILPITSGGITSTDIYSIKKGINRIPGELKGTITNHIIGEITHNTEKGIYGKMYDSKYFENKKSIEIIPKSGIKEGEAIIYCLLDNDTINAYKIQIEKVLLNSVGNKNMIIKIIDEKLINKTGGIIQGMSGSPIIQNGKLIGAVTHVFLNDPLRGYGVFIENMIEDISNIN